MQRLCFFRQHAALFACLFLRESSCRCRDWVQACAKHLGRGLSRGERDRALIGTLRTLPPTARRIIATMWGCSSSPRTRPLTFSWSERYSSSILRWLWRPGTSCSTPSCWGQSKLELLCAEVAAPWMTIGVAAVVDHGIALLTYSLALSLFRRV